MLPCPLYEPLPSSTKLRAAATAGSVDGKSVHLAMDNLERAVPSILYLPDPDSLLPLITEYQHDVDDMRNLGRFALRHPHRGRHRWTASPPGAGSTSVRCSL